MYIIDARIRAPFGAERELILKNENRFTQKTFGFSSPRSAVDASPELLLQEMDEENIQMALVTGRGRFADRNGELLAFSNLYPGRFGVLPYLNPMQENIQAEIAALSAQPNVKGFSIQYHSAGAVCYSPRCPEALAMYEAVSASGLPLMITVSGHTLERLDGSIIRDLDIIATSFPEMPIVITHGGWPWVMEAIGLAFRRENVYLLPDCYCTNGPGAQEYVRAANYMIPKKILFGSSYPLISQKEILHHYLCCAGFSQDVLPGIMGENARVLFKL